MGIFILDFKLPLSKYWDDEGEEDHGLKEKEESKMEEKECNVQESVLHGKEDNLSKIKYLTQSFSNLFGESSSTIELTTIPTISNLFDKVKESEKDPYIKKLEDQLEEYKDKCKISYKDYVLLHEQYQDLKEITLSMMPIIEDAEMRKKKRKLK